MVLLKRIKTENSEGNNIINSIIRISRDINRLILREKNIEKLMPSVCSRLIDIGDFISCSIFLKYKEQFEEIALAGHDKKREYKKYKDSSEWPEWLNEIINIKQVKIHSQRKFSQLFQNGLEKTKVVSIPMKYEDRIHGFILIRMKNIGLESQEKKILAETARDLALALVKIHTEDKLKESEQLYRLLAENANDFILLHDLGGKIIFFNQAGMELVGYSEDKIYEMSVQDLIAPEYFESLKERRDNRFQGNHSIKRYELEVNTKDQKIIPIEVVSTPFIKDGDIAGILIIGRDMTEYMNSTRELVKSKSLLERTQKIAHLGSWEYDVKNDILSWSDEVYRIFGYDPRDFSPSLEGFLETVHPEDRKTVKIAYKKSIELDFTGYEIEHRIIKQNTGETRYVLEKCEHEKNESGKIIRSVGMVNDITDLKHKEFKLRESEKKFRTLAQTSPMAIMLYKDDKWIYANSAAEQICGYSLNELKNMNFWEIVAPEFQEIVKKRGERRESGQPTKNNYEFKLISKDGQEKWVYLSGSSIEIGGENAGFITILDITDRKKVENELIKHRKAMQASMDGMAILNNEGRYLYVNKAHAAIYGYDCPGDFLGKSWKFLYEDSEIERLEEEVLPQVAKNGSWNGMATGMKKDGTAFPQEISFSKLEDGGLICVIRDVSEREQDRERLQFIHNIYRQTIVTAQEVPYQLNYQNKTYDYIGENCEELLGIPADEINLVEVRKLVKNGIVSDPDATQDYHKYNNLFKQGKIDHYKVELEIETPAGERKWISDRSLTLKDEKTGKITGAMGILRDITEVKEYEKNLEYIHNIYRKTIENASGIPYRLRYEDSTYEYMGNGVEELFGIKSDKLQFNKIGEMVISATVLAPDAPEDYLKYGQLFKEGKIEHYNVELHLKTKHGSEKWIVDRALPIKDTAGKVVGSMGIIQDITNRKRLEEQLQQTQKLESIGNLAAGVAHDFNNMLAVIKGRTEMALMEVDDVDPVVENLEEVLHASDRAAELTRQMLLFSRKKGMQFYPINVNKAIRDILKMIARIIGEDIKIITRFAANIWTIKADKTNINQVIMNIAVNARDVMPEGGKLFIGTENINIEEPDYFDSYKVEPGRYIKISLRDTGPGIDEKIIDKIFDPFFTTKSRAKGTGMGLAVVYGIVKKHKGYIDVESDPGKGTCFSIYLPAIEKKIEKKEKKTAGPPNKEVRGKGEKILLIEDDPVVCQTLVEFIKYGGYNMESAENGKEAMKLFSRNKNKYDLVISDVVLPDINGTDLIEKIQQDKSVPCLLISGYPDNKAEKEKIFEKKYHFIQKPFDLKEFLSKIQSILIEQNE